MVKPTNVKPSCATQYYLVFVFLVTSLMMGCSDRSVEPDSPASPAIPAEQEDIAQQPDHASADSSPQTEVHRAPLQDLVDEIEAYYISLLDASDTLQENALQLARKPSNEQLKRTIFAWSQAHDLYLSGFFLNDLLTVTNQPEPGNSSKNGIPSDLHIRLDQHTLLPGYLDSVAGYPYSGLIHSEIPLTKEALQDEFQLGDHAYVTLGFHAFEIILKGGDGQRKYSDFSPPKKNQDSSKAAAPVRRSLYGIVLASEIENDLRQLKTEWNSHFQLFLLSRDAEQAAQLKKLILNSVDQITKAEHQESDSSENTRTERHFSLAALNLKKKLLGRLTTHLLASEIQSPKPAPAK